MTYTHVLELDDPAKPHRRVWRCPSGVFVKTHAIPKDTGFGRLHWTVTGSQCDETGKALARGEGHAIHHLPHELVIESEGDMTPEQRQTYIAEQFQEALMVMVRRVEAAAINEQAVSRLDLKPQNE